MFEIKNGRLYPDLKPMCLSFEIPEDFWIDPCTEVVKPNFIFFRTADKTVSVEITFTYKNCDTTAEEVLDTLESCPKEKLDGPYPINVNGISGHYAFCANRIAQYIVDLDIGRPVYDPSGEQLIDLIDFVVTVNSEEGPKAMEDIHAAAKRNDVVTLLNSLRME
ncbi:MAG: hypothetical protein LUG45_10955 [Clostridiales bacterium]|nr:hypothetical protein [Clostridiales bacterium]